MDVKLSDDARSLGLRLENEIKKKMVGEYQMWGDQVGLLAQVVECAGDGDHLDIGTMWGGSAILAALVKKEMGLGGMVYTIDPLDKCFFEENKWYLSSHKDPIIPTVEQALENFQMFAVEDRVVFKQGKASYWPFPSDWRPTSALIDGAHDFDSVLNDWSNCSKYCNLIMFHDYTNGLSWKGVSEVVNKHALKDRYFKVLINESGCIAFVRKDRLKY